MTVPFPADDAGAGDAEGWILPDNELTTESQAAPPDHEAVAARELWRELLAEARELEGGEPPARWLERARTVQKLLGPARFQQQVIGAFPRGGEEVSGDDGAPADTLFPALLWCCSLMDDPAVCRGVASIAELSFERIRSVRQPAERVWLACLFALGSMRGQEPVAQLTRLRQRVGSAAARAGIERALTRIVQRTGLPSQELEERAAPACGLDEHGSLWRSIGGFTAEVRVLDPSHVAIRWWGPEGQERRSIPAAVRKEHAAELHSLQRTAAEIRSMLAAQRHRLESLLLADRSWQFATWRRLYLDHPLLRALARRLIWHFERGDQRSAAIWREGRLVTETGRSLQWVDQETWVRLWHPLGVEPEQVRRWRLWLEEQQVTQPFKQAHRELYVLTDAELATASYSNRFAGHLLKRAQFAALCRERGWEMEARYRIDLGPEQRATRSLPQWGLTAEFWSAALPGRNLLSTDHVRFSRSEELPVPLVEVPALLFSEVMRDVDLFVSVAGVGSDPTWSDAGERLIATDRWEEMAVGELNATALTRRDVLERLLPRLKIASRCSLEGKYLVVRGDLRAYKIHLGSGNVLMSPNDRYLCIVPGSRASNTDPAQQVRLPFEGDRTLSIILSKAFMLAEDTAIRQRDIVNQIRFG